ncbi:hypothetical protein HOY36_12710, partial [Enterococcus sp. MMGLQ5-2]|nr:hypothetical protein [Enterococcus sp. MMGLQ5-1]NPD38155.1 hypothetical protein [Enterococcus sp. MMGLQ5-2]NPD38210.1 hypothetical protein [Enterococcus sp. MMGLQ5-2]
QDKYIACEICRNQVLTGEEFEIDGYVFCSQDCMDKASDYL